jgi:hypothetical protein
MFVSSPSFLLFVCGFNLITIQLVSCNGSTCEYNLHFLDYERRLLSQQMFDPSSRNLNVVISFKYGQIIGMGPMFNVYLNFEM